MSPFTPQRIMERLSDKSKEAFKDAHKIDTLISELKELSGGQARMLYNMAESRHEDGRLFADAALFIKDNIKKTLEHQANNVQP